jgi:type I restriction enzyme S subunit
MMDNKYSNIPQGYKYSSLGIIPKDWEVKSMGELFSFKNGINASKENYGQGVKFVNTMDVLNNSFIETDKLPGSVVVTERQKKDFLVAYGDVLFNRTSETREEVGCSSVFIDNQEAVFGGFIIRAHGLNNQLYIEYKKYCFKAKCIRNQITAFGNGAIRYNLGQEDLAKVIISVPPLPEQQKIAEILSVWDSAIDIQTRLIASLQTRKRALMQRLFTGKKRISGFNTPWQTVKLKDLFTERVESNVVDLPLLSITADLGIIYQTDSDKKDNSNDDKSKYKRICEGDIGYNTMRMWQGRSALSYIEGIVSPAYTIVTPQKGTNVLFFAYLFQTSKVINEFWRHSQGLVGDTLNCKFKDFGTVKVFVPVFAEQTAIAERLTTADREIDLAKQKLSYLRTQKHGLMQQLLTGKKRVEG